MTSTLHSPEPLFQRLWRPNQPFGPRHSRLRRWGMLTLLVVLSLFIAAYWFLTDSARVRSMAEALLQEHLGGVVRVDHASISLFDQRLRLGGVTFKTGAAGPDATLFVADTIEIQYDLRSLFSGQVGATSITVTGPHVRLVENVDSQTWNYQRITPGPAKAASPGTESSSAAIPVPDIILRDARVDYSEIRQNAYKLIGSMTVEGTLTPRDDGWCVFKLQSRLQEIGPVLKGTVRPQTGEFAATLTNFHFGRDIAAMLPSEVRDWWTAHSLDGQLDTTTLFYLPSKAGRKPSFGVQTHLQNVRMVVPVRELLGEQNYAHLQELKGGMDLMGKCGFDGAGSIRQLASIIEPSPLQLENATGTFNFDPQGIQIKQVVARVEENSFTIDGQIDGYSPDAPLKMTFASIKGDYVRLPHLPQFLSAMPPAFRGIYDLFAPEGAYSFWLEASRQNNGAAPLMQGEVQIVDGRFACRYFPYPVRGVTGKMIFGRDPHSGFDRVEIQDMRCYGPAGGINAQKSLLINGWVGPFDDTVGCNIRVTATDLSSEPALYAAFEPQTLNTMAIFRTPEDIAGHPGDPYFGLPQMRGNFVVDVIMPIGKGTTPAVSVDLNLLDGNCKVNAFPYPLRHMRGQFFMRDGYVKIDHAVAGEGDTALGLDGQVTWPTTPASVDQPQPPVRPDLTILARNIPIDEAFISALPGEGKTWLRKIGLNGKIDVGGHIGGDVSATQPGGAGGIDLSAMPYDLAVHLHDGTLSPMNQGVAAADMTADLKLTHDAIELVQMHGRRGQAELAAHGSVRMSGATPGIELHASATDLALDQPLRQILPEDARQSWDAIQPSGTIDADVAYNSAAGGGDSGVAPAGARYEVTIHPRQLSVLPKAIPLSLDHLGGRIVIDPDRVQLQQVVARHGQASIALNGTGAVNGPAQWDLSMAARDLKVDRALLDATPQSLRNILQSAHFGGLVDLDISHLAYRQSQSASSGQAPPATQPADIDLSAKLSCRDVSIDLGMPVSHIAGTFAFNTAIRADQLQTLHGDLDVDSAALADRPMKNFKAELDKPANVSGLEIGKIQAELAGGELAGQAELAFPDDGPSCFAMDMNLRNADMRIIAAQDKDIRGLLSASLAMEGELSDSGNRRGRGDVVVSGKNMYQVPLLMGLLEITNLAIPINSPFSQASARYSIEGKRLTLEQIELRSDSTLMTGSGYLDFGSKKVRMSFNTDNPNWPKVPLLSDLVQNAKQELLQIQVRGTIQEPKVSASTMHTFTTTIDQVLSGGKEN